MPKCHCSYPLKIVPHEKLISARAVEKSLLNFLKISIEFLLSDICRTVQKLRPSQVKSHTGNAHCKLEPGRFFF